MKSVAYSELNPKSAAGTVTADVDEENDLQSPEDVPAKSVADGESNRMSAAGAFTPLPVLSSMASFAA